MLRGVRTARWKLFTTDVANAKRIIGDDERELPSDYAPRSRSVILYDLSNDPLETVDLAERQLERVRGLLALLENDRRRPERSAGTVRELGVDERSRLLGCLE